MSQPGNGLKAGLTLFLLACAANAQAALRLHADVTALTTGQADATRELLDTALQRLPPAWMAALDRRIVVEWRDDLPQQVHGRKQGGRLLLNRRLLEGLMVRPVTDASSGDPAMRAALAAVLHELAHFYDGTAQGRLSRDPRLLDMAGWQVSPMRLGLRKPRNDFSDRSPDRYELASAAEYVAVNLEHFLLDPDYACRRPAQYRLFSAHFAWSPPHGECASGLAFVQPGGEGAGSALLRLDPERVYAVDYLLAEGNEQVMSRWGHSMLRLVICAPGRPRGPDCRLDLDHHRVLSFRAFVDDVQISSWDGLTGSYPSRLFVVPLSQVVDEYTKVELRGLQSIPLRLDQQEIAGLLERAAQLHWSYDGRYYFLGNNCAVETYKLLHDGVPRLRSERLSSIAPTSLLRRLRKHGIADGSVLRNQAEAERLGYYFTPASAHYQAMYDVARESLSLPRRQASEWMELSPAARKAVLERAGLRASAALLLLEEAALRRQELLARDELKRRYLGGERERNGFDGDTALRDFLRLEGLLSRPAGLLPEAGYGLPQADERIAAEREGNRLTMQWKQQGDDLRVEARKWLPEARRTTLEATEANIALIGERLRRLHREQGGLQLP